MRLRAAMALLAIAVTVGACGDDGDDGAGSDDRPAADATGETAPEGTSADDAAALDDGTAELDVAAALTALVEPIETCVARVDTTHPVFHGCIDWHSAVHGTFALHAAGRLLGDERLAEVATASIDGDGLDAELADLRAGRLDHENPYGFSWFLVLDGEADDARLDPLATEVADRLERWIDDSVTSPEAAAAAAANPDYRNLGFAVFALHRWLEAEDPPAAARLRDRVTDVLVAAAAGLCPVGRTAPTDEFLDPCHTLALALADVHLAAPSDAIAGALAPLAEVAASARPTPAAEVPTVHAAGLGFSRAWALYHLHRALGDDALRVVGDALVAGQVAQPALWRDGYDTHAHWVAQFGVLALVLRAEGGDAPG